MSKILLLGGTGAMGVYLREILAEEGHSVLVTSRTPREDGPHIQFKVGNAKDVDFIRNLLEEERPDAVVDFMVYGTDEFSVRRDVFLSHTRHYVFLSSYRVFNDDKIITERSPRLLDSSDDAEYLKTDEYALCKARSENLLRESGLKNWTIIRPGITYSKMRFQLGCLEANTLCLRSLKGVPVAMPKEMQGKQTTLTWGRDVALMISRLILNQKAYGEDFNCASAEHCSWGEVCDLYKELLGTEVKDCSVEDYVKIIGNRAQVCYDRLFNRVLDNSKVLAATGIEQAELMTLKEGLSRELRRFVENPVYQYPNVAINARMDHVLGLRYDLKGLSSADKVQYLYERNRIVRFAIRAARFLKRKACCR